MRVLITGVAGFIGSHLADRFITEGHEVIGQDNFLTGRRENIRHLDLELIERDVADGVDATVDFILHFASPASPNPKSKYGYPNLPIETIRANAFGTYNCLELAKRVGAGFLMASTSEIYGDPDMHPQVETYQGNVDSVGERSCYDESKRLSEAMTMAYHRRYGIDTRIVRIFNTYGPRMRPDDGRAVPNFILQALAGNWLTVYGTGSQTRSFCYIDDLVEGVYLLVSSDVHTPVNIGNSSEVSIIELAVMINSLTGNKGIVNLPKDRFGKDPERRCPNIQKAKQMLNWEPKVLLKDGLIKTIQYYKESEKL